MVSDTAMAVLRAGAALVHAVPTVRLRVRGGDRVLAEVGRPPFTGVHPTVPACRFRAAVAAAHAGRAAGRRYGFAGADADPAVDVGVALGGRVLTDGVVRTAVGGVLLHVAAVALPAAACVEAIGDVPVDVLADDALDATLLHGDGPDGLEVVRAAAGRAAVAQLELSLAGGYPSPA